MSYQNPGNPRFYINVLEWENSLGIGEELPNVCRTLPVGDIDNFSGNKPVQSMTDNGFIAMLGHTIASSGGSYSVGDATLQNIVNQDVQYDGFSISTFENVLSNIGVSGSAGSIIIGTYYDMPNAPNLSLTMTREYGGTKGFTTQNGSSMSNTMWSKPPNWGNAGAWELYGDNGNGNEVYGCTNPDAINYNADATVDDGSCEYGGDDILLGDANQDGVINILDLVHLANHILGTDLLEDDAFTAGDLNQDGMVDILDLVQIIELALLAIDGCTDPNATNYNPLATDNDGSCEYGGRSSRESEHLLPLSRSGRRTWDLKFSYMDDGDLWGSNQSLSYIANTISGYEGQGVVDPDGDIHTTTENDGSLTDGDFNDNLLTDDNFFSQVWHKTLGGTLPFIFQPDGSNNNPDQFCIAKFKDSSLKATQSAYNVYDISVSIEEVW